MKDEQLWIDMLQGMENRASYIVRDERSDNRNGSWYARKVYGEQYDDLRSYYTDTKMDEVDRKV